MNSLKEKEAQAIKVLRTFEPETVMKWWLEN